jgi:hypothetical protein
LLQIRIPSTITQLCEFDKVNSTRQGRRGLIALQDIPRSQVIVAVPDEHVFALSSFPAFQLAEPLGVFLFLYLLQ